MNFLYKIKMSHMSNYIICSFLQGKANNNYVIFMKTLHSTLILLFCFILVQLEAQEKDKVPYFIPPSPTAYELGKVGQIQMGMFTGTPNITVPSQKILEMVLKLK